MGLHMSTPQFIVV